MPIDQLPLLPDCAVPACTQPVTETGDVCPDCQRAFGTQIRWRRPPAPAPAATPATTEPERKRNQRCWLCEQRRTCTRHHGRWECDTCHE